MEGVYASAKPLQDQLADKTVEILKVSREIFRRIIVKHVDDVPITRTRIVAELSCSLNPLSEPALKLSRRLNELQSSGVKIVRIDYDEIQCRYVFHADAEGEEPHVVEA